MYKRHRFHACAAEDTTLQDADRYATLHRETRYSVYDVTWDADKRKCAVPCSGVVWIRLSKVLRPTKHIIGNIRMLEWFVRMDRDVLTLFSLTFLHRR